MSVGLNATRLVNARYRWSPKRGRHPGAARPSRARLRELEVGERRRVRDAPGGPAAVQLPVEQRERDHVDHQDQEGRDEQPPGRERDAVHLAVVEHQGHQPGGGDGVGRDQQAEQGEHDRAGAAGDGAGLGRDGQEHQQRDRLDGRDDQWRPHPVLGGDQRLRQDDRHDRDQRPGVALGIASLLGLAVHRATPPPSTGQGRSGDAAGGSSVTVLGASARHPLQVNERTASPLGCRPTVAATWLSPCPGRSPGPRGPSPRPRSACPRSPTARAACARGTGGSRPRGNRSRRRRSAAAGCRPA